VFDVSMGCSNTDYTEKKIWHTPITVMKPMHTRHYIF